MNDVEPAEDERGLTYSSATSSGTYLEKLPKDIIGYLRGFTGPDPLYQIPYQLIKESADGNMHYYSLFATSKKVKDQITAAITALPYTKWYQFKKLTMLPDYQRIGVDTRESWNDPIKTIKIDGRLHMVLPMKLHIPKYTFNTVTQFGKEILNDMAIKMKKCLMLGCQEKRPKELDYCWKCLEKCRDTKYSNPKVLQKRQIQPGPRYPGHVPNGPLKRRRMFL